MSLENKTRRLKQIAKELNIGTATIVEFLTKKGFEISNNPNTKIDNNVYEILLKEFKKEKKILSQNREKKDENIEENNEEIENNNFEQDEILIKNVQQPDVTTEIKTEVPKINGPKIVGKIAETDTKKENKEENKEIEEIKTKTPKIKAPKIIDTIDINEEKKEKTVKKVKKVAGTHNLKPRKKRRKRIIKVSPYEKSEIFNYKVKKEKKKFKKERKKEISKEEISAKIKETLARLSGGSKSITSKYRKKKREEIKQQKIKEIEEAQKELKKLKVTEFITLNELANIMDVQATELIQKCLELGLMVSINQRLDKDTLSLLAEEYGYEVQLVDVITEEISTKTEEEEEKPDELVERPPIVTVMGHVDHGKTSLLDYIRNTNVIAGEAGGITQHIGAYSVTLKEGKKITFIDTPGHEAFTAMRARGAQVTDIVIIVIAADDKVMPQTEEAISHAKAAGVPIIFAINKIDKANANPEKIKEQLANMNILVEDWGGEYLSENISAKTGKNVHQLLEKILTVAELLELKANPKKKAKGTVIESSLDKGRGYVSTLLVQDGTLKVGDIVLAGTYSGKIKAMFNERSEKVFEAGPSIPVQILGLDGAPNAGDKFIVMNNEKEAREIASKRQQLIREQGIRAQKHITLDEIGRRLSIGDFKELNIIIKGDVAGSIEALSDALYKLSTEKIQINIIHKSVGQITESDVLLASASNAIIIGFQVRPSVSARKIAEKENVEIRLYSIIYDAIEHIEAAIKGMHAPEFHEKILGSAEVREIFKISKVGTVAGSMVLDGKIIRNAKVRIIREGLVIYTGEISSLKRFKDDVKEVLSGYECGLTIKNFNDIKVGDIIEAFEEVEKK